MSSPDLLWPETAVFPTPQSNHLYVWSFLLQQPPSRVRSLFSLLSADERDRASRFYFERDRDYYIVGRAVLRQMIGRFLGIAPHNVQFAYGAHGKPDLHPSQATIPLQFNLTHAEGIALLAVGTGQPVGIDIEPMRQMDDMDRVANYSFSTREYTIFQQTAVSQQPQTFFNCWTRKEAFIKAVGEGFSYPLKEFEVSLRPDAPPQLVEIKGSVTEAEAWSLRHLEPANGFVGALAIRQPIEALHCWQWGWEA